MNLPEPFCHNNPRGCVYSKKKKNN